MTQWDGLSVTSMVHETMSQWDGLSVTGMDHDSVGLFVMLFTILYYPTLF